MGWETDDERLPNFREEIVQADIEVETRSRSYGVEHPNTYRLTLHQGEGGSATPRRPRLVGE